jgi:mannose-6-phosphate isomerase-like protein (cupin superfamily)
MSGGGEIMPVMKESARVNRASVRRLADQEEFRSTCGFRRDLSDLKGPIAFHYIRFNDARKHYHKKTTEYYFIAEGAGEMELDDRTVAVRKGDLIVVPPGTRHAARATDGGVLEILVMGCPPIDPAVDPDQYYD